jgi:16S rRNA (adenine1518-N6/adenine1519-N6)-dimethyltransferase
MRRGLVPKKRFGQNFLVDRGTINKIIGIISQEQPEHVIEIGPGRGEVTLPLAKVVPKVTAIELDQELIGILRERVEEEGVKNIHLVHGDILTTELEGFMEDVPLIFGNLPYNIATQILLRLEGMKKRPKKAIFMVQKEVAERICAAPGSRAYGALSVLVQYFSHARRLFHVKRSCFWPSPEVDSTLIELDYSKPYPRKAKDEDFFRAFVSKIFRYRRKVLLNVISHLSFDLSRDQIKKLLLSLGIKPDIRPEQLNLEKLLDLSDELVMFIKS